MGYLTLLSFYVFALQCGKGYTENQLFTKEPALWSLRCLYAGEDRCTSALTDYVLPDPNNVTFQELEDLFGGLDEDVQKAFIQGNLTRLSSQLACKIPENLLLLIPEKHLSLMSGDTLGTLLDCNQDDLAIARLIGSSIETVKDPYSFYTSIQSKYLQDKIVIILGDEINSLSSIKSAQWLVSENHSILEYLSPAMILDSKYNLIPWMKNIDADNWNHRPQRVKRIWAVALKKNILPDKFSDWDDSALMRKGHFLVGSTVEELEELSSDLIQDKITLFQYPFSLVQIRGIFDHFYRYQALHRNEYEKSKSVMQKLLPKHFHQFIEGSLNLTELSYLKEPTSLATSRQIVEYMVHNNNGVTIRELISTKEGLLGIHQLLYCVPLSDFYQLNYSLKFDEALILQHHKLSLGQVYLLTEGGTSYQLSVAGVDGAQEILRGLPTVLLSGGVPNSVYLYLMSKVPASVPPRAAALLQNFIYKSANKRNYKSVFKNKDAKDFFSFLPSKYIQRHHESLLSYIKDSPRIGNDLPEYVLSAILTGTGRNFRYSNTSDGSSSLAHPVLLRGLSCTDVKNMSPLVFIHVISRFNSIRSSYGWAFPKNLQQCSLNKLAEYLNMKSAFMTYYLNRGLVSLITSSDVEAVGGFVLAGLPLIELRIAPQRDLMVKAIGLLSLPELLLAANMDKLMDIGNLYFRPNMGKDLFNLGNLTAFLAVPNIEAINPQDFKLMLESGLLDRRSCVPDTQRDTWSALILEAFGPAAKWSAQDLVTLGDLLLVIPHHDLMKVDPRVWSEVADLLANSGYFEVLHLQDGPVIFYEFCEKLMPDPYEATTFRKELVEFVGWILKAAQLQMDSVVTAYSLKSGTRKNPLSVPKPLEISPESDETEGEDSNIFDSIIPFSSSRSSSHQGLLSKVSCDAIRTVGKPSELYLTAKIIEDMGHEEVENCRDEFAQMDLPKETASIIWKQLDKRSPHLAGKLLSQASPTDLLGWDLSFEDMWAHETIFYLSHYNHNNDTISALVEVINKHKQSLLSVEQVVALGHLTCQVTDVKMVDNVFFQASRYLGATLPCEISCLQYFEPSFQNVDAYGPITDWTPEDVESLGILIAGLSLEDWVKLVDSEKQLLSRFGTRALQCLPKSHLQALSESAVRQLPTTTAVLLKNVYEFNLNSSVGAALNEHLMPTLDFNSPSLTQIVYAWEDNRYVPRVEENSGTRYKPLISTLLFTVLLQIFMNHCYTSVNKS